MRKHKRGFFLAGVLALLFTGAVLNVRADEFNPDPVEYYSSDVSTSTPVLDPASTPTLSSPPAGLQFSDLGLPEESGSPAGYGDGQSALGNFAPGLKKTKNSPAVFYVNSYGYKTWVPNMEILLSYGGSEKDIREILEEEMSGYLDTSHIRLAGTADVYSVSGRSKILLSENESYWLKPGEAMEVNQTELDFYNDNLFE